MIKIRGRNLTGFFVNFSRASIVASKVVRFTGREIELWDGSKFLVSYVRDHDGRVTVGRIGVNNAT